ncbi:ROK family protein [Rubripirellula reticaptiva]|uniref:Glucokinase n=1 Tax=Rubripirellula reticaptiva TaxID=2528013 RepID=A0A5C6ESR7_9BACT|nr:ROK family protein [Rubripirellula reticaptiva]TWU51370.1 Glucokinase [Rubripirellula reticaptiva]
MAQNPDLTAISDAKAPYYWGIDVGGTGIKIGLVDDVGNTLAFESLPTRESEGATAAMQRVAAVINDFEEQFDISDQIRRVGLGAPGPIDLPRGYLVAPPQLPSWWDFPIRDFVSKMLERPVSFLNDANAAAFGEHWIGTGKGAASMLLLTLGTGVGAGIILEDRMVNGVNSFGSECGHILVDPSPTARLCAWGGGRGQLEAYASASAVVQRTRRLLTDGRTSLMSGHLHGNDTELTAKRVYEAALESDELALEIIDETAKWLGIGITSIVHTVDPGTIVLGGAMNFGGADCPIGQRFLQRVTNEFKQRTFENVFNGTTIGFATLGADAGYLGAAGYARNESHTN